MTDERSPRMGIGSPQWGVQRPVQTWHVVRCLDCGHQWDDDNPDDEVCACLDKTGSRRVEVVSVGASNQPQRIRTGDPGLREDAA